MNERKTSLLPVDHICATALLLTNNDTPNTYALRGPTVEVVLGPDWQEEPSVLQAAMMK